MKYRDKYNYPAFRKCSKCLEFKPMDTDYFAFHKKYRFFLKTFCKSCAKAEFKKYYSKHKERLKAAQLKWCREHPEKIKARDLRRKYSMTVEDYNRLVSSQEGKCKICDRQARLVVDHDHATGKVRGLLCRLCNTSLGFVENQEFLVKALSYLRRSYVDMLIPV